MGYRVGGFTFIGSTGTLLKIILTADKLIGYMLQREYLSSVT